MTIIGDWSCQILLLKKIQWPYVKREISLPFICQCYNGFFFSRCVGWLEPLLARIAEGKHHVVTPVIETINDNDLTLRGTPAKNIFVGKFNWQLTFDWMPRPANYAPQALVEPVRWVFSSNTEIYDHFFFLSQEIYVIPLMFLNILYTSSFLNSS